ncbi:TetR family transcriptional regulator [Fluviicoccus keumensis]|uniref:TetR family transcriptional regulator n=1 Tax=Fluviicoccus keumensis TaxID=1435465 RepID=A0A4Q7YL97_9GAMM|nr:HTH-type transcriptional repressor FabR [Fluviicoccus keumensis]RZU38462.1 TetR family transcriptional regulator [Fluviicoccus keumensis]
MSQPLPPSDESAAAPADAAPEVYTGPGRRAVISRDDLIQAAMKLVGPNRSVSTISLREVAREAGIAPNSFYRHFRDTDELAIALIDLAGSSLRQIIGEVRRRANRESSVTRLSVEVFLAQLTADEGYLSLLLREGSVGSPAFKEAVERQLHYFEEELTDDLIRLSALHGSSLYEPRLAAKAITRLVFAMGASAIDTPKERHSQVIEQTATMVRMILVGAETMQEKGKE